MIVPDLRTAALPEWEDLTPAEIQGHRDDCLDGCGTCAEHRAWGVCPGCEDTDAEAIDGQTVCCDQPLLTGVNAERWWNAA